jgi:glycerol-1-phosphate dehydrogenase [NAD(P)+]
LFRLSSETTKGLLPMNEQRAILNNALRDASITREVVLDTSALAVLSQVWQRRTNSAPALVVADSNTYAVAGVEALAQLRSAGINCPEPLVLPAAPRLKPKVEVSRQVAQRLRETGATPVAVGSGVINDLVKYAAALAGTPYVCVATAASMDGYAASGAALIDAGVKRTLSCPAPVAVLADLNVLAAAPAAMTGWGYGDLAGKVVAGADWILADALGVETINPGPFNLVQNHVADWLADPKQLAASEPRAFERLLCGLLVSGLAMQAHVNTRPASGSDHQFAHLWEMEGRSVAGEPVSHGACVGVGCVAMLALYEWLCAQPIDPRVVASAGSEPDGEAALEREIKAAFSSISIVDAARTEMAAKRGAGERRRRLERLVDAWPSLRDRLVARLPTAQEMQAQLRTAGAPAHPADLGIELDQFSRDHFRARLIRRRYTILDLAEDLGWLDQAVSALFAADGFWGRQSTYRGRLATSVPQRAVH